MGLIKKVDVPRHFAARRWFHRAAVRPLSSSHATGAPATGLATSKGIEKRFPEASSPEHSSSNEAVSRKA
jgi:hypothetical protein